jgi:hypothetical protein
MRLKSVEERKKKWTNLQIRTKELQALINKLNDPKMLSRATENALYNATSSLRSETIKQSNHKWKNRTGTLGGATIFNVNGLSSEIFIDLNRAPYGQWIYEGRKETEISPVNTKALSWAGGGERFFSKGHKIGAIKADPYILNTYNKRKSKFLKQFSGDLTEFIQDSL